MIRMKTSDLIALMHVLAKFKKFDRDLINLLCNYSFKDFASILNKVVNGTNREDYRFVLAKKFYDKHYDTINTINVYTNLEEFIDSNYISNNPTIDGDILLMYKELIKYRELEPFIIKLLEKIQSLGIDFVCLNPDILKEMEGSINIDYEDNDTIDYFYNTSLFAINDGTIYYKSLDTPYVIHLSNDKIEIEIQNLLFSIVLLPESISKEEAFNVILAKAQKVDNDELLMQYEKLQACVADLNGIFIGTMGTINNLNRIEDIYEIRKKLIDIKRDLNGLSVLAQTSIDQAKYDTDNANLNDSLKRIKA